MGRSYIEPSSDDSARIAILENITHEYEIYELIASGTSGTVTFPAHATIAMDQYPGAADCLIVKVDGTTTRPIDQPAMTAGGIVITGTLASNGNWTISGTPSAYPVALIYQITLKEVYKAELDNAKIVNESELLNTFPAGITVGTLTGMIKGTTGVMSVATADSDYQSALGYDKLNILNEFSTGIKSGFTITINADTTKINISAGKGKIIDNSTPASPTITEIDYAGVTGQTLDYIATNLATYLAINSSGVVIQQVTNFTPLQRRSLLVIGAAIHSNKTIVNAVNNLPDVALSGISQFNDLCDGLKGFNISGNVFSANGANLNINKSIGYLFKKGANFINDPLNPHTLQLSALTAPTNIRYRLQDGTEYTNTAVVDPDYYDLSGVRTALLPNKYTIQRISVFSSNLVRIQYGQHVYNSKAEAIQAISTETYVTEQNIADNGLLRCLLVVESGTTALNAAATLFFEADRFGSTKFSGSGAATTTMQQSYDNSTQPQIVTSTALGAVQYKRGSTADTDKVVEILNGSNGSTLGIYGNGNIGLGIAPTSYLTLKAGTATASTAPIKLTSGTLLSSAEIGAVEFLTDKLYFTITTGTTRKEVALNDSYYGGLYAYNKTIPFNITVADTYHPINLVTAGDIVTGLLSGFTFDAGRIVDANITSEASGTGGKLRIVCSTSHGLTTGSLVVIGNANNAGHNKPTRITTDATNPTTEFLCDDITYVAGAGTSAATVRKPAYLLANTGSTGIYNAQLTIDGTASNANKLWKWELNNTITSLDNIVTERNSTNSLASMTTSGNINITAGDKIWISGKNVTDTTDYTIKNLNLNLHRV